MRILFVAPRFHTNQYQVVKTLQENGHEVFFHVAFLGPTEDHSLLTPSNFRQSIFSRTMEKLFGKGGVKRPYYFPELISYWKEFNRLRPDVVVIRDPYKYFSFIAAFYAFFIKAKIIFYTQEELYRSRSRINSLKGNLMLSFFKAAWMTPIIGTNNEKAGKLKHMYFVPLPIPLKLTPRVLLNESATTPGILMVGKYHQDRKKHLLFIEAISRLKEKHDFKVTIVGECAIKQQIEKFKVIEETVKKQGLSDTVALLKNVPFHKMEELYTSHDIFVLPAINEQYGVSVTEALAYGLPVICTDTCGARFNISNGENGYVVKSSSVDALVEALDILLSDKRRMIEMSNKASAYVQDNLSGNAFYENFSKLIHERFNLISRVKV